MPIGGASMSFDGIFTRAMVSELNRELENGRIGKVHQPFQHEIILTVRANRKINAYAFCASFIRGRKSLKIHYPIRSRLQTCRCPKKLEGNHWGVSANWAMTESSSSLSGTSMNWAINSSWNSSSNWWGVTATSLSTRSPKSSSIAWSMPFLPEQLQAAASGSSLPAAPSSGPFGFVCAWTRRNRKAPLPNSILKPSLAEGFATDIPRTWEAILRRK